MAFTEDLDRFFGLRGSSFAVTATIDGNSVTGIFDHEFVTIEDGLAQVEAEKPVFTCATSDVSAIDHGDTCTVNGTNYLVVSNQPDGTGVSKLLLEEV